MVYVNKSSNDITMSLSEYIDFVQANVDARDFESMTENAWALRALANDRTFLLDIYHDQLKRWENPVDIPFSTQSVMLHSAPTFLVRANIWPAAEQRRDGREKAVYAYEVPHNHNFHLCTVGYFGPGYVTDVCRCEDPPKGYIGEKVKLTDFSTETLGPGTTMVYEAFRDIHSQLVPEFVSVSLNLLSVDSEMDSKPQCILDTERGMVGGSVGTSLARKLFIIDLLRHMHNDESVELLVDLSTRDCVRTSALALNVLRDIMPTEYDRSLSCASEEVRELCTKQLAIGDDFMSFGLRRHQPPNS